LLDLGSGGGHNAAHLKLTLKRHSRRVIKPSLSRAAPRPILSEVSVRPASAQLADFVGTQAMLEPAAHATDREMVLKKWAASALPALPSATRIVTRRASDALPSPAGSIPRRLLNSARCRAPQTKQRRQTPDIRTYVVGRGSFLGCGRRLLC
jgi:hypothetical protein